MNSKAVITTLIVVIILESALVGYLAVPRLNGSHSTSTSTTLPFSNKEGFSANYSLFDAVIANDTEVNVTQSYESSWILSVNNNLLFATTNETQTEAQIAIGPIGPTEALSIPTLIIQERADGLLRVEYYAQNWPNTYGLILYNATRNDLFGLTSNISLEFIATGPPGAINPQIAPRANGNLTIFSGDTVLVSDYPISWAKLDSLYFYGLKGTDFTSGDVTVSISQI
jgi:hypothetical protein